MRLAFLAPFADTAHGLFNLKFEAVLAVIGQYARFAAVWRNFYAFGV